MDAAKGFIDKAQATDRPFFVVIWFGSPHEPYSGHADDLAGYADLPASLEGQFTNLTSMETGLRSSIPLGEALQARYAEITAMDRAIGDLRRHIEGAGARQNTLLWYCSDNGAPSEATLGSPLRAHKGRVYEGGVRVPSVIEWPDGIPAPATSAVNTVTSDILPTLCDLTGRPVPERPLDGTSLAGVLNGTDSQRPEPICFWRFDGNQDGTGEPYIEPSLQQGTTPLAKQMSGLYTRNFRNYRHSGAAEGNLGGPRAALGNRFKLVLDGEGTDEPGQTSAPAVELFDIREDPAEQNDVSGDHPEEVRQLADHLDRWQRSVLQSLAGADYPDSDS